MRPVFSFLALTFAATLHAAPAAALHELTYSGDQSALVALDRDLQAADQDPAKLAAIERQIVTAFVHRDATFAARQALAQRLALVLTAAPEPKSSAHKTLTTLLADPHGSDVARLALQPVHGAAVDALFVKALAQSTGTARLGLLDAIATRRIASAVEPLTPLLRDDDARTAAAAARALGEIGTTAALAALRAAPIELTAAARLAAAARLPARDALPELRELEQASAAPAPVRHAAFRTSLDLDPASAATRIAEVLRGKDAALKQVALEAIVSFPAGKAVPALVMWTPSTIPVPDSAKGAATVAAFAAYDPGTQAALIAALGRRGEADAVSAVSAALAHSDAAVRTAAITALGFLPGTRDVAFTLARIIANAESADESKLARQSLARLNGPGVSATILAGAQGTESITLNGKPVLEPKLRPVFVEQLALRNQTEALPLLFKARTDSTPAVRLAAVAALGEIAPLSTLPELLDWTVAATDDAEQSRALRSLVNVILRDPATDTRGQLLFDAIDKADSAVAQRLLPALARIGGGRAADTAARLAIRDDPKLATAATAVLARWPDPSALGALATVAEKAAKPATRNAARAGVLRYFERNRDPWSPAFTRVISRLVATSTDGTERKTFVALLHRASDSAALDLAQSLSSNPDAAVATAAKTAVEVVRANQLGAPALRASGAAGNLKNMLDGKTSTRWNVPAEGEEWLEIDFKLSRPLHSITLDQTTRAAEFPPRYEVHITDDPAKPGPVVVSGEGERTKTVIELPAGTRGRYVLIKNVAARKDSQWSVVELHVD